MVSGKKTAIIIGAGPAGLTAAYELLSRGNIKPILFEKETRVGGLSRSVVFKGNRMDIGGHRFFSKYERILQWWLNILPLETGARGKIKTGGKNSYYKETGPADTETEDRIMLVRERASSILFERKLYHYPISFSLKTFRNLGFFRTLKIFLSFIHVRLSSQKPVNTLEDLFIHRFGTELYKLFFRDYTKKVWGIPCHEIKPEWGLQRISVK